MTVTVRYIVNDVDESVDFYVGHLGFEPLMRPAPGFAMLRRGPLRLALSAVGGAGGGSRASGDTAAPEPGGWNRFQIEVEDLDRLAAGLEAEGVPLRTGLVEGRGGNQIVIDDPSGNPVELFEPKERGPGPGS